MAKVTMTLYEALTRKKNYEDRLKKFDLSSKAIFGKYTKNNPVINGVTLEEASRVMKSNFDSFIHLNKNILSLQIAINKANLEHTIVIPGYNNDEPVTLCEAITQNQKLAVRNNYINTIAKKLNDVQESIDATNSRVLDPKYIFEQVSKMGPTDKKSEDTSETLDKMIESFKDKNTALLLDPNKIVETNWVEKQRQELDNFTANMHSALVKANTEIVIEVELED